MTVRVLTGDCRNVLSTLPAGEFHTCVTSPPYFGLRDYGHDGQIGLESTPDEFVAALVAVFREVRRVLRDDGTVWLNLGDSYAGGGGFCAGAPSTATSKSGKYGTAGAAMKSVGKVVGVKPKDLIGIPWRVAFALQADSWYLRQDIIWAKPNPMPESVRDRCTKAHEYLFLLSKRPRYYFDAAAISEPSLYPDDDRKARSSHTDKRMPTDKIAGVRPGNAIYATRNRRSVWNIATQPYSGAHFATFPPALIEPCILAGCPKGGNVLDPFGGAGTTGLVADRHQRNATLIELNPTYAAMARARLHADSPLFAGAAE